MRDERLGSFVSPTVSARALRRIQDEMSARKINQTDLAGLLGWTQSRVSKILNQRINLEVDDLAAICFAINLSIVEAVRDHGLEFLAEMTPSELRILEQLRLMPPHLFDAFATFLNARTSTTIESRGATPRRTRFGRARQ